MPSNQIEHDLIVANLLLGGSLQSEAEPVISARKTAFNKAFRDFKKETGTKSTQSKKS